ncbi:MAG: hypothetical protein O2780_13005 [Proteobacteria bacterium]|jgi:hypothetical protein|nr:hypothetical protein [Pseudomonadota bacterium]MDA1302265.1 hypothetical protein [Pseudomonadota bacterium]
MDIMLLKTMALLGCFVVSVISVVGVTAFLVSPTRSREEPASGK